MAERLLVPKEDFHLIQAWGVPSNLRDDLENFHKISDFLVTGAGFTIFGKSTVAAFPDQGLTYSAILTESAVNGHTWPELDYVEYLFHTCKQDANFDNLKKVAQSILETPTVVVSRMVAVAK